MLPKLNAKARNKIKRRMAKRNYHAPPILKLKQTPSLEACSHRGLVVGMKKQPNQHGQWV